MLARLLAHPLTERIVLGLIVFNAITLGLETYPAVTARYGPVLQALDHIVLSIFVAEILARITVHRLAFFRDPWNVFDFLVIAIALVPISAGFTVLRALRILRALRLITVVPSLKRVVRGLVSALPGMGSIMLLLMLVFFVFAVIASKLYGEAKPELFGNLGLAAYTLFQVMTFDDWSAGIVKPLLDDHPFAWAFFISFMVLSSFMVLNLFIGVVVTALDEETAADAPKIAHPGGVEERILGELAALRSEVAALRAGEILRPSSPDSGTGPR
ncbi:ion transporter [Enterovirga rhinocerotis]|uniref:Voltage-gated sodium channel n=1 Tax=Enterovirga rhinocerotis TaxID=1339210 RepID=A0A4R7C5I5_9HYPH|nr:ion transporter [Enterovirga rhinocerotis]TDR93830.1 voltage-gated sodium channel [Enterovirga rhinocerotis]